jgi:cytochrome c peroxidase
VRRPPTSPAFAISLAIALGACRDEEGLVLAEPSDPVTIVDLSHLAAYLPAPPPAGPVVELGRMLFFDPRLSIDNDISCATCHDPDKGWTDGLARSVGHRGKVLRRNAPSLVNPDARLPMFWDGRARDVEQQVLMPITSAEEMAQPIAELLVELAAVPEYLARFDAAFPGAGLREETLAKAIAAFERTLQSAGAPLDRYLQGDRAALSAEQVLGLELFVGKARCTKCHEGPHLTDAGFHNLGVGDGDVGRLQIVDVPVLKGAFKTPGLRDVALTAPYLHDGSLATLEAVMEIYDQGGGADRTNLDGDLAALSLTPAEKAALVAFMHALSGAPIVVRRPELPRDPRASDRPLAELMTEADGMLDSLDRTFQSLNDENWGALPGHVSQLLRNAEDVSALRIARVKKGEVGRFHLLQGRLIVAIKALDEAVTRRARADAVRAYHEVRGRCADCHEVFRPETLPGGRP